MLRQESDTSLTPIGSAVALFLLGVALFLGGLALFLGGLGLFVSDLAAVIGYLDDIRPDFVAFPTIRFAWVQLV
jgi:hypothetical protein